MARSEARIFVDVWDDPDFVALPSLEQRLYFFLMSQRELAQTGVLPLRERRWARSASGLTAAMVSESLGRLEQGRFVVIDEDTEELLIRAHIRRDKVYKQPNVLLSALDGLQLISSKKIKRELLTELYRIAESGDDMSERSWDVLKQMIVTLEDMVGEVHRNPVGEYGPIPSGNPSADPSRNPSANPSEESFAALGSNPSENPTGSAPGDRGVVTAVSSDSPSPSPLSPDPTATAAPSPKRAGKPRAAGGQDKEGANPEIDRVVAHLVKRIADNGFKQPNVTDAWRKEVRLLLAETRPYTITTDMAIAAIDFAMTRGFYRRNVQSTAALRRYWDKVADEAKEEKQGHGRRGNAGKPSTANWQAPESAADYFND